MVGERTVSKSTLGMDFTELPANSTIMDNTKATAAHDRGRIAVARMVTGVLWVGC